MQSFLEGLADYHIQNHLTHLSDICFVFPGRRAGLFFNRSLGQKVKKPIWKPKTLTISEFFGELTPTPVNDAITLLFKLHGCYQEVMKSDMSIDEFLPFGEMLLNDFNDIDKYLANPEKLFTNLADLKALEDDYDYLTKEQIEAIRSFWSTFDIQKTSGHQQSFIHTWEKLFELYSLFNHRLRNENEAYEGMVYRATATRITAERFVDAPYHHVVFAGFNALNACEKKLFHFLNLQGKAAFFWDYPQWIMDTDGQGFPGEAFAQHEALRFVRQNLIDFPPPKDWQSPNPKNLPDITITSAPNDLVQAQIAHDFLISNQPGQEDGEEKTALILADESQLFPALYAIPEAIKSINVTLGYPLKSTPAYGLIENLLALQKSARTTKEGKTWFYHRPLLALLRHQYMNTVLGETQGALIRQIVASNQIFVEKEALGSTPLVQIIFNKVETASDLTEYLNNILLDVFRQLEKKEHTEFEQEFVFHLFTIIRQLSDIVAHQKHQPAPETWQMLFRRIAEQQTVAFKGEPLSGLQIMGLLETRALDFDKLIILSMNEGIFPRTSPPNSFIPFNLRKGHGLPTIDNQDAIFAYYFYRLINRARVVKLVYSTTKTVTGEGEMSRFLQQIHYEYPGVVRMETAIQKVNIPGIQKLVATKTPEVNQQLEAWLAGGKKALSPSALSTYVECPLRFYYKYIVGIKEPESIGEDLDPRVFGNLFHQILELIYAPFTGKEVSADALQRIIDNEGLIRDTMNRVFVVNIPFIQQKSTLFLDLQGKNSLIYEVLYKYIRQFLKKEKEQAPFLLRSLEEKAESHLTLTNGITVRLGGTIDRTDLRQNTLRIIDYKTGHAGQSITDIADLFDPKKHGDSKAIFQTLLYCTMLADTCHNHPIAPAVIQVKQLFSKNYSMDLFLKKERGSSELITLKLVETPFAEFMDQLLLTLFNPEIPFTQTTCEDNCQYCAFREHCLK